ncbi:MAG: hypothetical protein HY455_00205 [Parcubacteria group bacterium]|nr:hypothetical protein [Parcubacteria group bacterium]
MKTLSTKNIVERIKGVFDYDSAKTEPSPYRDWMFLVVGLFVLLILSAGVGVYLFIAISDGEVFASHALSESEETALSIEDIGDLEEIYKAKEATLVELLTTPPPRMSDPSQ